MAYAHDRIEFLRNPDGAAASRSERALPWIACAAVAATVAAGLALDAAGVRLGTRHPPFLARWDPVLESGLAAAAATLAAAVTLARRILRASPLAFVAGSVAIGLAVRLAVASARGGPSAWDRVFDPERSFAANYDYLAGLPALADGRRLFLDRFAELVPALPVHASGHPPGLLLTLDIAGIRSPAAFAALCIGSGALATPLTYLTARPVLGDERARIAALVMLLSPAAVLFGATSPDAMFVTLGLLAAWPLAVAASSQRARPAVIAGGAVALAFGALFAWSLLAVGAWAVVLALLHGRPLRAATLGSACAAALVGLWAVLFATTGFDPVGTLHASADAYAVGVAAVRPYAYWLFGSPAAFLVFAGIPMAWYALRSLAASDPAACSIFAVIAAASLLGFTKAETERIWLFLVPLLAVAAASVLPERHLGAVLWVLALQTLATETLADTVW